MLMVYVSLTHGGPPNLMIVFFYITLRTEVINDGTTRTYNLLPYVLSLPNGNDNGYNLASSIQDLLNANEINFTFEVVYNTATGTIKIEKNLKEFMLVIHSVYQVILV